MQDFELLAGLVVEVRLHFEAGGFEDGLVVGVEVAEPVAFGGVFAVLFGVVEGFGVCVFQFDDIFRRCHVFAFHPADFHEVEIGEVQDEAGEDEDARPHLHLRATVGLRAGWFLVADRSRPLVLDGKPDGHDRMKQQRGKQPDFEHLDDIIGAHEVAESVVPFAAIVPEDEQVGAGVEQQEEAQEGA